MWNEPPIDQKKSYRQAATNLGAWVSKNYLLCAMKKYNLSALPSKNDLELKVQLIIQRVLRDKVRQAAVIRQTKELMTMAHWFRDIWGCTTTEWWKIWWWITTEWWKNTCQHKSTTRTARNASIHSRRSETICVNQLIILVLIVSFITIIKNFLVQVVTILCWFWQ